MCKPCACLCFVNSVPAADVRRQGSRFFLQLVSFLCVCVESLHLWFCLVSVPRYTAFIHGEMNGDIYF